MDRYQLAKIVAWSGSLHRRKRLQKVVFMLQSAGCPLEADFTLHHYGPYSAEVAQLSDEMVRHGWLEEDVGQNAVGREYSYRVADKTRPEMDAFESTDRGAKCAAELARFEGLAQELLDANLKRLEYAATIVYFCRRGVDWSDAVEKATAFKHTADVRQSETLELARKVIDFVN